MESMKQVMDYAGKKSTDFKLQFCLEPCDSRMDVRHLLGPTSRAIKAVERIKKDFDNIGLTMDTAHVAEEGEDFMQAMEAAKQHCNHIHFANCQICDPHAAFYGDKHVGFDYPGGTFTYGKIKQIYDAMARIYASEELTIALEIYSYQDNAFEHFEKLMAEMPWYFWPGKHSDGVL